MPVHRSVTLPPSVTNNYKVLDLDTASEEDFDDDEPIEPLSDTSSDAPTPSPPPRDLTDKGKRAWPPKLADTLSWSVGVDFFANFTPAQWDHWVGYLYRSRPRILKPRGKRNIDKFVGSYEGADPNFSVDYVRRVHGGGNYYLLVVDTDKPPKQQKYMQLKLKISMSEYPPIVNLNELDMEAEENRSYIDYLKRTNQLTQDGIPMDTARATQASDVASSIGAVGSLLQQFMTAKDKGNDTAPILAMMQNMMNQLLAATKDGKAGKGDVEQLKMLVETIKAMQPTQNASAMDSILPMMIQGMMNQTTMLMEMMLKREANPPTPPPVADPIDTFTKMLAVMEKMNELRPEGNPAKRSTLEVVIDGLATVLQPIAGALTAKFVTPPEATETAVATTTETETQPPPQPKENTMMQNISLLLNMHGQTIINSVYAKETGQKFASQVVKEAGEPIYARIKSLGPVTLLSILKAQPTFWVHLKDREADTKKFIEEFCLGPLGTGTDEEEGVA